MREDIAPESDYETKRAIIGNLTSVSDSPLVMGWRSNAMAFLMRRRLHKFIPIVVLALAVQVLAPIGACWAAAVAASDPLLSAEICHGNSTPTQDNQTGEGRAHDGACASCCVAQAGGSFDMSRTVAIAVPYRQPVRLVWFDVAVSFDRFKAGSHAQARAPPSLT